MTNDFISIDISQIDLNNSFFHYTNKKNLPQIFEKGLEPRIGKNSIYLEKTPKVFFAKGEIGIINIMDVWLRWLIAKSGINNFIYWLGTFYMRLPFCIKGIPNIVVKNNLTNLKKRIKEYKHMQEILDNSIFLILKLEENIDFDYNDVDEVKQRYYESFLKLLYTKNSKIDDNKMEYWNMHTYSNKTIEKQKIKVLSQNENNTASVILKTLIEKNMQYVKENCDFLYEYYNYIYSN